VGAKEDIAYIPWTTETSWSSVLHENLASIYEMGRYLAAHSPTMRSQDRTYKIASQLHNGKQLFE
jgi:hypothetical protein